MPRSIVRRGKVFAVRKAMFIFSSNQFDSVAGSHVKKAGLWTIPKISDDQRYFCAAASRTIFRTDGSS
jgi:hypothetical protein